MMQILTVQTLLHQAIFVATCLSILLCRCDTSCMNHCLVKDTQKQTCLPTFLCQSPLHKVELTSTSCNNILWGATKKLRDTFFSGHYTRQQFMQLVSQQKLIVRQLARKIAQFNSAFSTHSNVQQLKTPVSFNRKPQNIIQIICKFAFCMNMSGNFIVGTINARRSHFYFVKQSQEHLRNLFTPGGVCYTVPSFM